jgi:hypothetical protein
MFVLVGCSPSAENRQGSGTADPEMIKSKMRKAGGETIPPGGEVKEGRQEGKPAAAE